MQINQHITLTSDLVHCATCRRDTRGAAVTSGSERLCRHASADEVRRILALLAEQHRRREAPQGRLLETVQSHHHNGTYELTVLPDGSYACTCLSFLGSRDLVAVTVPETPGYAACKHIRDHLPALDAGAGALHLAPIAIRPPSNWQKLVLKAFSVEPHELLTNHQAYVSIRGLLKKQGVEYPEFERLMRRQGKVTLLPVYAFGVEFEGAGIPRGALAQLLTDAGVPTEAEAYNHNTSDHFKVVTDGSVQGSNPFELVSPKLFGAEGFEKVSTLCRTVQQNHGDANASCGLHVHVDAFNCRIADARRLVALWHRIQPVVQFLVPPSRRNNQFCKPVTPELVARVKAMRSVNELGRLDRYCQLNLSAFGRHGTFEYRIHGGTFNASKVQSWIVFVLLVTAAARAGLEPESVPVTWEGVSQALGLTTGTSVIQRAWRYLTERHGVFSAAERGTAPNGSAVPPAASTTEAA